MSNETAIEWTHMPGFAGATWNPTVGCEKIAQGCKACYAKTLHDKRHKAYSNGAKLPAQYAKPFESVQLMPERLDVPLRRRKPTFYFVNSVSDLFHDAIPFEFIAAVYGVMAACPQHRFCILTKRPKRMREFFDVWLAAETERRPLGSNKWQEIATGYAVYSGAIDYTPAAKAAATAPWPLPNVIHGYSAANQSDLDAGINDLLATPSALRCLSLEPLVGPIDPTQWLKPSRYEFDPDVSRDIGATVNTPTLPGIDWLIVGGESGPGARPCDVAWIRSIVQQCKAAGVPCFVKQLGSKPVEFIRDPCPSFGGDCSGTIPLRLKDRKGGDPSEWPSDIRIRQFPNFEVARG